MELFIALEGGNLNRGPLDSGKCVKYGVMVMLMLTPHKGH